LNGIVICGRGSWSLDRGLYKEFEMTYKEGHKIQIRRESFNLSNSVCFSIHSITHASTSTRGRITSTSNSAPRMQFAVRCTF
jgi:hypothetical protein